MCRDKFAYFSKMLDCVWNVMAHAQKPDFVFRQNGPVHLNWRGRQFSRQLAAEVCASAVGMLDTPCSEVVWRVLATHSIRQFLLHFPSRASPCAITFQLKSTIHHFQVLEVHGVCGTPSSEVRKSPHYDKRCCFYLWPTDHARRLGDAEREATNFRLPAAHADKYRSADG